MHVLLSFVYYVIYIAIAKAKMYSSTICSTILVTMCRAAERGEGANCPGPPDSEGP